MKRLSIREQARLNRRRSLPALIVSGLVFILLLVFSGFGVIAILALIFFCMVAWYMLTAEKKLEEDAAFAETQASDETHRDKPSGPSFATEFGPVFLDEGAEEWVAYPRSEGLPEVRIPAEWGRSEEVLPPRQELLVEVARLFGEIDSFETRVLEFIRAEERARRELKRFESDIMSLKVGSVSFLWVEAPTDCIVNFYEARSSRNWYCKLSSGKVVEGSLGFDT